MTLSLLIGAPLVGAALTGLFPKGKASRAVAFLASAAVLLLALTLAAGFDDANGGFQFKEMADLVPAFGIHYSLGIDGISLWLVLLTAFVTPCVVLSGAERPGKDLRGYYASLLVLESAVIGTLVSTDLFLFYLFWELMLIPAFFLIGIWGGKDRVRATLKFVLYTMAGSLLMLVGLLYVTHEARSFDYTVIFDHPLAEDAQFWCFLAFALAFLIKVPLVPFHAWLADAYTEAPTGGTVLLSAVLVKLGAYGLLRFCIPLFPFAAKAFAPWIMALAAVGVVHGALMATVQTNFKRLVAYSSLSHMNLILLGLFTFSEIGLQGGMFLMISHGVYIAGLFLLAGALMDRKGSLEMRDYGGWAKSTPVLAFFFLWMLVTSAGLPGFGGFVGEILILVSAFKTAPFLALAAISGFVLGAWYLFRLYGKVFFGLPRKGEAPPADLSVREVLAILPIAVAALWLGLAPNVFFRPMEKSLRINIIEKLKPPPVMTDFAAQQRRIQEEVDKDNRRKK